jgi:hypothetical protein
LKFIFYTLIREKENFQKALPLLQLPPLQQAHLINVSQDSLPFSQQPGSITFALDSKISSSLFSIMLHINRKSLAKFSPVRGVIRYRTDAVTACETHRRSPSPVRHHPGFAASSSNKRSRLGSPSEATLYLQHSTLPAGARTLKAKPKTLQHSTLPLGSGKLKDATLYLQHSTLPSGSGTLKSKPKTLQHSTLPLGSGTLKDTPSTLQHSTLPPGSGTLKGATLAAQPGSGTPPAIQPSSAAIPFDRQALAAKSASERPDLRSTTALLERKAAGLPTTKTTRTFADRHHLIDLLFAMLPTYAIANIIGCSD